MTDHPNLKAARAGYEAFAGGDLAAVSELMADDIVWHVGGSNMVSGDYAGKEAVLGLFATIAQETSGSFDNEIHDILANDEHGVALVTTSGQRGDKTMSVRGVHVFHMDDGRMTEFWNFPQDQAAVDSFWS